MGSTSPLRRTSFIARNHLCLIRLPRPGAHIDSVRLSGT